ncbi:hypothetical protein AA101099_2178 [Neoasaia chiangmaiensis NBRC 101099]|uniref:Uncharacterized protein n=1 Tax=Neoasaia chiangmaiensis TaxID=320497 RepID=A0A1U9KSQ2_9PROT|nr:hypothetical protein [Neoasaia chiangmaiensis]AQS88856.1 hypothetical protein A0U93_14035 [Neoasaia chiangmaiensis]GBR40574.1 hypothetical protein AA101099_2178 [Neoasaia chiangmaiensis NBRC 101099]GEN13834.1 hypothetical protein NCH01_02650 [Neoasaia chiangmaiensis]
MLLALPCLRMGAAYAWEWRGRYWRSGLAAAHVCIAAVAAMGAGTLQWGPWRLDPLTANWSLALAVVSLASPGRHCGPLMLGAGALLCESGPLQAFLLGLAALLVLGLDDRPILAWRLGLLGVALLMLGVLPVGQVIAPCAPLALLLAMPALAPVCIPLMVDITGPVVFPYWPPLMCLAGLLPLPYAGGRRNAMPLLWAGVMLAARRAELPESALAAGEAMMLTLVLPRDDGRLDRLTLCLRSALPGAAGFLPLWLGLHALFGLAAAMTEWIAGAIALVLAVGWSVARQGIDDWRRFGASDAGIGQNAGLVVAGLLAVCPGVFLTALSPGLGMLSGAPAASTLYTISLWEVPGGDGGRWYPPLAFLMLGLPIFVLLSAVPWRQPGNVSLPDVPICPTGMPLPFPARRVLVWLRRSWRGEERLRIAFASGLHRFVARDRHAPMMLAGWLLLLAVGLAMLAGGR